MAFKILEAICRYDHQHGTFQANARDSRQVHVQFRESSLDQCLDLGFNLLYFLIITLYLVFHSLTDITDEITSMFKCMELVH